MPRALTALTIGWLEPEGRDGVIADLKTFSALGLHGAIAVTAVEGTALDAAAVASQVDAVLRSMRVDAVKLACPASPDVLEPIATLFRTHDVQNLVLDPGPAAFDAGARAVLEERLLPLTRVVLPNVPEAAVLAGRAIETWDDMREAAKTIATTGAANVVIKGGKREGGQVTDLLYDGSDYRDFTAERMSMTGVRGAGTTFEAAVTASIAKDETVHYAVAAAKAYVTMALQSTYDLGDSQAMHHFYRYWRPSAP